jgi:hypothetical protein
LSFVIAFQPRNQWQMADGKWKIEMSVTELCKQIIATYSKHGWALRRVLLRPQTRGFLDTQSETLFPEAEIKESEVDALWFSRDSHEGRQAWELRLLSETPYALFETFEPDEAEEDREELRLEMEARLRAYASKP